MMRGILSALGKYRYAALALALGLVLLLWPQGEQSDVSAAPDSSEAESFDRLALQREMEQLLSAVEGAGKLSLMLTVASGSELELAEDETLEYSGSRSAPENYERTRKTLTLGSGTQSVVVTRSVYPAFVGAVVVCEGADSAAVRLALTQAVATLTGLPSDCITVIRGEP